MYAKLIARNIRRSLRDYSIYFLTLVFAVAIFYVFNSLGDQPAFQSLHESTRRMAAGALEMLSGLTYVMTGVVALLVLYANRVIMKKRSRELGTYLLLGMEQGRLSMLLLAEVMVIGLVALLVGQVAGLFLSQFFALLVARLFDTELSGHSFVFSASAAVRTLVTYGFTFVLVGLWQAAALYRQRLINLINGVRKNEQIRLRNRWLSMLLGVLSLGSLGFAYWLSDQVSRAPNIDPSDPDIMLGALLGVIGTYLLYLAAAGLLTRVRQGRLLKRGLNLFLYRQVTTKINTNATMLATISLMLTFTLCAMAFGLGLGRGMRERAEMELPYDYLLLSTKADERFEWAKQALAESGISGAQWVQFQLGHVGIRGGDLMDPTDRAWFNDRGPDERIIHVEANLIGHSTYQQLRAMKGYPAVNLAEGQYLIHASADRAEGAIRARQGHERFMAAGSSVIVAGGALKPVRTQVYTEPLGTTLAGTAALLVVPDDLMANLTGFHYMVVELPGAPPESLDLAMSSPNPGEGAMRYTYVRAELVAQSFVIEGMLLFLTAYVGIMFILISATLLALQQVTDAVEHRQRFAVLRKLGADDAMIDSTIARQVGLYFLTPVIVALIHSLVAMTALARTFEVAAGYYTVWSATLVTLGLFLVIYGAYYLLSLQSCRTLFKEAPAR